MRRAALLFVLLCSFLPAAQQAQTYKPIAVLDAGGHNARVMKLLFHRGGQELISVSEDKTVRLWDLNTGELIRVLRPPIGPGKDGMLYSGTLSPDGKLLAVGGLGTEGGEKPIYLIDLASGAIEKVFKGHQGAITTMTFLPDGRRLVSGSRVGPVQPRY
jgi:WD40 repeat protein